MRIAIVSTPRCFNDPNNVFLGNSLRKIGVESTVVDWKDATIDWKAFDAAVIRTPWNYCEEGRDAFLSWAESVPVKLINSAKILRWNTHKAYLRELEARKVETVATEWVPKSETGPAKTLAAIANERGWRRVVVKPAVSAGGRNTHLAETAEAIAALEGTFSDLVKRGDVMVQPFMNSIRSHGELSFVFAGGSFTHCARKTPSQEPGSFFIHEKFGGKFVLENDPPSLGRSFAEKVLNVATEVLGETPTICRVDMLVDCATGRYLLSELEVAEPSLYHELAPHSADVLAEKLKAAVSSR